MGFEPTTSALGRLHSTTELRPRMSSFDIVLRPVAARVSSAVAGLIVSYRWRGTKDKAGAESLRIQSGWHCGLGAGGVASDVTHLGGS